MNNTKKERLDELLQVLVNEVPEAFKFHGEIAMRLFLNDVLYADERIEICVNRNNLSEVLRVIPNSFNIKVENQEGDIISFPEDQCEQLAKVSVYDETQLLMRMMIYDIDDSDGMVRLNNNIKIPKKYIYYHSLKWNVDYIKPEFVLMQLLHEPVNKKKVSYYRDLIDKMSYFQFVTLKATVGEEILQKVIMERST
ncbi:hypothetical protein [Staphylococcus lutrae]|uniref:Uncharacterized protein n=1 Tax=Staphylococcus lutrae TaxID=155085 RepID=A0AAC9RUB9_9STAP|nr:hypothetical protein [Staphylococcus lutrae]ARJ51776.1 hypothetical protein B5P37_10840 [Staphylococcus lutrae]PNZ35570.1 hypothetical protein CD134_09225 [Staphylococcus lutrae]